MVYYFFKQCSLRLINGCHATGLGKVLELSVGTALAVHPVQRLHVESHSEKTETNSMHTSITRLFETFILPYHPHDPVPRVYTTNNLYIAPSKTDLQHSLGTCL